MEVFPTKMIWVFLKFLRYFWCVNSTFSLSLALLNETKKGQNSNKILKFGKTYFAQGLFSGVIFRGGYFQGENRPGGGGVIT